MGNPGNWVGMLQLIHSPLVEDNKSLNAAILLSFLG